MKTTICLFIFLLFVLPCYSQKEDFLGWRGARWGMTEIELQKTFKSELKKLPKQEIYMGAYVDYAIPNYEIAGKKYTVLFQMGKETHKLRQVLIRSSETYVRFSGEIDFNRLESLLTRKYGNVSYKRDNEEIYRRDRQWVFPTTTIELSYSSFLTIRYFPTKSRDFEKV